MKSRFVAAAASAGTTNHTVGPSAVLCSDRGNHIPLSKALEPHDLLVLLTPVVVPVERDSDQDPFEPLGKELARYHPRVRHVPYTAAGGITSTHVGFIKKARALVFVITGPASPGQPSQVELSNIVQTIGDRRPHVVVACCAVKDLERRAVPFPTVVQLSGYSRRELEMGAEVIFLGQSPRSSPPSADVPTQPWNVTLWDQARDVPDVCTLWNESMPSQFRLPQPILMRALQRDGYAKHFIVREPGPGPRRVLGFCATYLTYLDSQDELLVGSIAALIIRPSHRRQGIGRLLHEEAMRGFKKTRGVSRVQLGSTYPRLFYGLPVDHPEEGWFRRRGWRMDGTVPGTGQEVSDWLLSFDEWPTGGLPQIGLTFRQCQVADLQLAMEVVERVCRRDDHMCWFDQYAKLLDSPSLTDIVLGFSDEDIVATAITYTANSDNPNGDEIPWPPAISDDTGGVTCICITDVVNRDAIMVRLLDTCIRKLKLQNKNKMFVDAIKGGATGFQSIGFQRWATYKDVWMDM
ncbi:hypothetical protein M406DRAFT_247179 [Cryphonectria parasitica EP155]|uniref:N-acetyltransferase domain-containing protein n=1 Tax=Cryphonectria parasitica (strain ATCC 38755 / EP155) TaxID=660469 RepID=A0A9P5CVP0_CRYP1|nr:uncharacterized protein M406DRAFT_247179 [Cryphonectria parasitica EP155]KAF3771231.1 hypothetical protein M406DRAFT_247179 [Cryphonectria parasitica EP155]